MFFKIEILNNKEKKENNNVSIYIFLLDKRRDKRMANNNVVQPRHPIPPFTAETAALKVKAAENAWNTRNAELVAQAYTVDTEWRNRSEFINGREQVIEFLKRKWAKEHDYKLEKELWAFTDNRIAVRFEYEWHDDSGNHFRSYGNENWEFDELGYMRKRFASINDVPIKESERKFK